MAPVLQNDPARILFIAEGQLGDLLLLIPALSAMKTSFPASHLTVLVVKRRRYAEAPRENQEAIRLNAHTETAAVLADCPAVDAVVEIDRAVLRSLKGWVRLRTEARIASYLRSQKFDMVVCTFPEDRFVLWAFASGARVRIGQRRQKLHTLLTRTPDLQREDGGVLRYYSTLAAAGGARVVAETTGYKVPVAAEQWAGEWLRAQHSGHVRWVVVHPGASGPFRIWPPERYAALIEALAADSGVRVLLCGTAFDRAAVHAVKKHLPRRVLEIDFGDSIARFAAVLQRSALCISNDSGPRHLSIALGVPSLAFMPRFQDRSWKIYDLGPSRMAVLQGQWACPVCPADQCRDKIPPGESYGSYCMRMIATQHALESAKQLLACM